MMKLIRGKYVLTDALALKNGLVTDGAVLVREERIAEVGAYADIKKRYPQAEEIGGPKSLVMPGIIDAHTHGRGISYVQKGIPYDFLENCLIDWTRAVDLSPELNAKLMAARHIKNGSTMLNHIDGVKSHDLDARNKIERVLKSYRQVGIRAAYSPGLKDINALANDDERFFDSLPEDLKAFARPLVFFDKEKVQDYYVDLFQTLRSDFHSDMTNILLGPSWAHGCTDLFYKKIMELSERYGGLPMHIHTLQTPYQKAYGEAKYGKSLLAHLKDIGVVDKNLVLGHAVYLNEADIEILAQADASITHHASCNLAMRNGISPVYELLKAGVNVALGIDEKAINDDEDVLMELRMIFYLHRVSGFELDQTPAVSPETVLAMGTRNAARTVGLADKLGVLKTGMLADIIVVDTHPIFNEPWTSPDADILLVFISRAKGVNVTDVIINGETVMRDRVIQTINVDDLYAEAREYMQGAYTNKLSDFAKNMQLLKPYYQKWYAHQIKQSEEVFYKLNSRK